MFSLNSLKSVTKIFVMLVKGVQTCHLATSCVRSQDAPTVPAETHVRDMLIKWIQSHALVIY